MRILIFLILVGAAAAGWWWSRIRIPAPVEVAQSQAGVTSSGGGQAVSPVAEAEEAADDVAAQAADNAPEDSATPSEADKVEAAVEAALNLSADGTLVSAKANIAAGDSPVTESTAGKPSGIEEVADEIGRILSSDATNLARMNQIIEDADISDTRKNTLKRLIETAGNNPDLLRSALEQVKSLMN